MASKAASVLLRRLNLRQASYTLANQRASFLSLPEKCSILQARPTLLLHTSTRLLADKDDSEEIKAIEEDLEAETKQDWLANFNSDPKDRTREIPLELSLAYLESDGYKKTYGDKKIWELYRRNFAAGRTHAETRKTCVRNNRIDCGNPCPICRDEYLVVDYRNLELLNQFIDDYNGTIYSSKKTGVCQKQYKKILIAIDKARDLGLLTLDQPFVEYDYEKYNQ